MKKKSIFALIGALGAITAGGLVFSNQVSAYRGDLSQVGPNYSAERHVAMMKALNENNYDAWKDLQGNRGRVSQVINKDNFAKFALMHKLRLEGKNDQAEDIRKELGLGLGGGQGRENKSEQGRRGQNKGGNFVDNNGDGKCDKL